MKNDFAKPHTSLRCVRRLEHSEICLNIFGHYLATYPSRNYLLGAYGFLMNVTMSCHFSWPCSIELSPRSSKPQAE